MKRSRRRIDINLNELDQVLDHARAGPLSDSDCEKLRTALHTLAELLSQHRSTEKISAVVDQPEAAAAQATAATETAEKPGHGRNPASAFTGARKVEITHRQLKHGDGCPECRSGKVYTQREPRSLVRIVGQAPLSATVYELQRLRCNACNQVFTAEEPEGVGADKYDE